MAITKQTVKIYSKAQLETFGLAELKAIAGNYSRLIEQDCTPSKYSNRKSAWMEAIESAQATWRQQQAPEPETLFDVSAYNQPQNTHRGLAERDIDTRGHDPYWDTITKDLQDNAAARDAIAAEYPDSDRVTVLADNEKRFEPQEICSSIENNSAPEAETQSDRHICQQPTRVPWLGEQLSLFDQEERAEQPGSLSEFESAIAPDAPNISDEEIVEKVYRHIDYQYDCGDRQTILSDAGGMDGLLTLLRRIEPSIPDELASQVLARFPAAKPLMALKELSDEQPGFCSPDTESAIALLAHNTEDSEESDEESDEGAIAPEKSPAADDDDDNDEPIRFTSKPRVHPSPITRSEAAAALGISEERVIKDPTPTLNCCVVVYLDDQGKKRSQFVSYRRFEFWREQLKEAIDAASPETIQAVEERMLREFINFQRHYPHKFQNELRLALRRKKEFLFPEVSKKSSNKKAIAV